MKRDTKSENVITQAKIISFSLVQYTVVQVKTEELDGCLITKVSMAEMIIMPSMKYGLPREISFTILKLASKFLALANFQKLDKLI